MNVTALHDILRKTCGQLRKGEVFEGSPEMVAWAETGEPEAPAPGGVLEVYAMPHESDPAFDGLEKVDLHFVTVVVNKTTAEAERANLIALLNDWPDPDRLAGGPSYIEVGGVIGDQGAAFELFALGKVLGIWDIITPESVGFTGEQARQMAGSGYIMCTGFRRSCISEGLGDACRSERGVAQFFFEIGYGACWAEAFVRNDCAPFELTDALIGRAWEIAPEAHDDHAEFDRYLALATAQSDLIDALKLAANRLNRIAVDGIASGSPSRWEHGEWANEAFAAVAKASA